MIDSVCNAFLQRKTIERGDIQSVRRRPAFFALSNISGRTFLACAFNQIGDQTGFSVSAMHLRQAHRYRAHAALRIGQTGLFRRTRNMRAGVAPHLFGDYDVWRDEAGSRGDDEGIVGAFQYVAHRFDSAFVDLPVLREFREIVDEGEMDHAVGFLCAALEAVEILQRAAMNYRTQFLEQLITAPSGNSRWNFRPLQSMAGPISTW